MSDNSNPLNLSDEILIEYKRWEDKIETPILGDGRKILGTTEILQAHFLIVDFFVADNSDQSEGLGGIGPRSLDLLESAVGRQNTGLGGTYKWNTPYEICATLFFGLIKNHPFHDANKRTAFLSLIYLLHCYGIWPNEDKKRFEELAVKVADDKLESYSRFKEIARRCQDDTEVRFIADFIRRYSSRIDRTNYTITFRDLKRILSKYGYEMENPSGNMIDIVSTKTISERKFLGFTVNHERTVRERVCHIGFPGWTRQVSKGDIKKIRVATKLDEEHGYDAKMFFDNSDNLNRLMAYYQEPLRRLAYQ